MVNAINRVMRDYMSDITMPFLDDIHIKGCPEDTKDEMILCSRLDMECVCVYVCVRERDSRDTRSRDTENRIRKLMY